ncbi:hypothetical protein AQUCO_01500083v1 [Aquilegia coerulea]|uniref:Uncharacterized protein n=1 Tax=Aquilegia coerulea TaxID=218851 RepID=A0A2G5DS17_AQUCA|nr:hypothetical protein AQUCO_01500083v1 [Aquilegia coerulea]
MVGNSCCAPWWHGPCSLVFLVTPTHKTHKSKTAAKHSNINHFIISSFQFFFYFNKNQTFIKKCSSFSSSSSHKSFSPNVVNKP